MAEKPHIQSFVDRMRAKETPQEQVSGQELVKRIGQTRLKAMQGHKYWKNYIHGHTDHAFKHRTVWGGDHEVEVYGIHRDHDKVEQDGKVGYKPKTFVRFQFYKHRVTNAHLFRRRSEDQGGDWGWAHSHKKDEE
jgi:hypothetical protein